MDSSASGDLSRVLDDRETRITVGAGVGVSGGAAAGSAIGFGVGETAVGVGLEFDCNAGVEPAGLYPLETAAFGVGETAVGVGLGIGCNAGVAPADLSLLETAAFGVGETAVGGAASVRGVGRWEAGDPWPPPCEAPSSAGVGVYVASDRQPASETAIMKERSATKIPFLNASGPRRRCRPSVLSLKGSVPGSRHRSCANRLHN